MQENKEQVEICAREGADAQVAQCEKLSVDSPSSSSSSSAAAAASSPPCGSSSLTRFFRPQSSARHRVAAWFNCSSPLSHSAPDAMFNGFLKVFFLLTLALCVTNLCIMIGPRFLQLRGTVLLQVCATVAIVSVLVATTTMMRSVGSPPPPPRKVEVKTISALVQHV